MNIKVVRAFFNMSEENDIRVTMFSDPYYVLLHFKDPMLLRLNGKELITNENAFILYEPGYYQDYSLYYGEFRNDYVWFSIDDPDEFFGKYDLPKNRPFYLKEMINPDDIGMITWMLTDRVASHEDEIENRFFELLDGIYNSIQENNTGEGLHLQAKKRLVDIRSELIAHPEDQSVEQAAKRAYMSVSMFTQQYKKMFGISPGSDIHRLTIDKAKSLLEGGSMSVSEISDFLGYSSTGNFIRAFKKQVGITPYRYKSNK